MSIKGKLVRVVAAFDKDTSARLACRLLGIDDWREEQHPRDESGKFTSGGSGSSDEIESLRRQIAGLSRFGEAGKKRNELSARLRELTGESKPKPKEKRLETQKVEVREKEYPVTPHKTAQFDILQRTNPMRDDHHVGIRKPSDIRSAVEAFRPEDDDDGYVYPDFTREDGERALKTGKITLYSSYPIRDGVFVSPSKMMSSDYAGGGKVYSKTVSLSDVAWINANEGQYASVAGQDAVRSWILDRWGEDGGPGSGNFGHKGRPGKRGGSGKGGGSSYRAKTAAGQYVGVQKAKAFKSIANTARATKDYKSFVAALSKEQQDQIKAQYEHTGKNEKFGDYVERLRQVMASTKPEKKPEFNLVQGRDLNSESPWDGNSYTEPRFGQIIDTQIEDIIVRQGYNGPPKIVSQEEFDKITAENPEMPILFRSYAAPNAEVLQDYDDMLESGQWYVDCGVGGAQYGQGMYCAGVYEKSPEKRKDQIKGAIREMEGYRSLNLDKCMDNYVPPDLKPGENFQDNDEEGVWIWNTDSERSWANAKPKPGQEIAMVFRKPGSLTTRPVTGTWDGHRIVYPSGLSANPDNINAEVTWAPISRKDDKSSLKPVASTRMMTLDPNAKIISYTDAANLKTKAKNNYVLQKMDEFGHKFQKEHGLNDEEMRFMKDTRMIAGSRFRQAEARRRVEEYRDKVSWSGGDLVRLFNFANQYRNECDAVVATANKEADRKYTGMDLGTLAAMHGYDAINANNHGESGSYTVVLNRTKVILSSQRVKV